MKQNILNVTGAVDKPDCHGLSMKEINAPYSHAFKGPRCMERKLHLEIGERVTPEIMPPHCVLLSLKDRLNQELTRLEKEHVKIQEEEPSVWVSSVIVTEKPNGKLRVCIDHQHLNRPLALTSHLICILLVTRQLEDNFAIVYNQTSCKLCHIPNYVEEKNVEKGYLPGYHESLPDQLSKERYGSKSELTERIDPYEILKTNWKDDV